MTPVLSRTLSFATALTLILVLGVGLVAGCSGSEAEKAANKPAAQAAEQSVPAEAAASTQGEPYPMLDLAAYKAMIAESKGKAVLVCVWSVNCPACQQELPVLEQLADAYSKDDLRIVYASVDNNPALIAEFFGDYTPIAEVVRVSDQVAVETGAEYIPRLVLYDREGNVSFKDSGFYPQAMLQALVERALGGAQ